ncbi:TolB family protein [Armatimonas rosea]|uniref:Dipeptidyl aminopeptidase/acylaminoacyl peptidase n=1 Tax=Armatimonas rosea TaxID=685828 RepID=A0A7W9SLU6_ARMRO|nr:LpqB family beta-propeller domain-containing protein [Armatimonas rosea]MBB6048534.1 dipeptidyl aminopeptidase/acylaminoacyl peptidase [Armatimonas rosea]
MQTTRRLLFGLGALALLALPSRAADLWTETRISYIAPNGGYLSTVRSSKPNGTGDITMSTYGWCANWHTDPWGYVQLSWATTNGGSPPSNALYRWDAWFGTWQTTTTVLPFTLSSKVAWTRDGQQVSYAQSVLGTPQLFTAAASGTGTVQRTTLPYPCLDPAWSPDGQSIAFVSVPAGGSLAEVWVLKVTGGSLRRVTVTPTSSGLDYKQPAWSPDGTKLAVVRRGTAGSTLWTLRVADGGGLTQVTTGGAETEPCWSPDGTRLAFCRSNAKIVTCLASGGDERLVALGTGPSWSGFAWYLP